MLQHYCAWRCTLFWPIPHIQIQYGPLSLQIVANTFCICSPLAGHILLSGSFWCLLPDLELPQVVPLFLLSDCLTTILSTWGFSKILGYWPCKDLSFHFSSFIDFILDLNMCFRALAFSEAELSSLFSNSGIVTSLLNLVAFLVIEFMALDLSCP